MQIGELARELGIRPKELIEFLNEKGGSYKNHMNKATPEEEYLARLKFGGSSQSAEQHKPEVKAEPEKKPAAAIIRKKEPEKQEEPAKGNVTTIIRRKGDNRSFVPEENRPAHVEVPVFSEHHEVPAEQTPPPPAAEMAPSAEIQQHAEEHAETPALPVEEKHPAPEVIITKTYREEAPRTDGQIKPAEERKAVRTIEIKGLGEEEHKESLHRKRKVVIPDTEDEKARKTHKQAGTSKGASPKKRNEHDQSLKVKGKIRGGDINLFVEEHEHEGRFKFKKKDRPKHHQPQPVPVAPPNPTKAIKKIIKIENTIIVSELAHRMGIKVADIIKKSLELGEMVAINQRINFDLASVIASEFGFQVENVAMNEDSYIERYDDMPEQRITRPPVVTVMGHVDHGKTKLLDAIRNTNIVDKEAGGITQHIGAYTVELEKGKITFLDTPGHEAFTAMRSRGAQATDIVILIVAADDGVMPQTVEAISHAKAAQVPIIVAINKIDKPDANPERVRQELLKYEIVPEEWGGSNLFVEISAKQRLNIDKLLESVLLQVEVMDLKANPDKPAVGIVIESRMDPGRGAVATTLIKEGTLKVGDLVATAATLGYIRSMTDWKGVRVKEAGPSMAVEITGLDSVPPAGEMLYVFTDEKKARGYVDLRKIRVKEQKFEKESKVTLENLFSRIEQGEVQELPVIVKGDVDGSVEAINASLAKIGHDKIKLRPIHSGVGGITENDVLLASASRAIIIGFNVRIDNKAKQIAVAEGVDIRIFSIIYDLIDSIKNAMSGMLAPIVKEEYVGTAEIRQIFRVSKVGAIGGCMVTDGRILRKSKIKLIRNNIVIYEGVLSTLKRFKDDAKEVKQGFDCGLTIENYNDIKEGDTIECYIDTEVADEVI